MNILTFDIEDWFHILDNEATSTELQWKNFSSRIDYGVNIILDILADSKVQATFFCLGWIAQKYPHLIKKISDKGFDIASHSYAHQLVYKQSRLEFETDLLKSLDVLQAIVGKSINTYRAPGFSIVKGGDWAFEILQKNGINIDASVFPAKRAHGGFVGFPCKKPCLIQSAFGELKELPMNSYQSVLGELIFSGGGYFRMLPYGLIKRYATKSAYVMTYLHPRDFDANQPMIPGLSQVRKFKSYTGLKGSAIKLKKLLHDFEFTDVKTAVEKINWAEVPKFKIDDLK